MRTVLLRAPLPRCWKRHRRCRALFECDLAPSPFSRLRLKVLVFRTLLDLYRFWDHGVSPTRHNYQGIVAGLGVYRINYQKGGPPAGTNHRFEADPRYFAVMGLCVKHLGSEVTTHEIVHAAFAYAERVGKKHAIAPARSNDSEAICYPAGRLARRLNIALYDSGMYELWDKHRGIK